MPVRKTLILLPLSVAKDGGAREYAHGCASERKEAKKRLSSARHLAVIKIALRFLISGINANMKSCFIFAFIVL